MELATVHDMASRPRKTPIRTLTIDPTIWKEFDAAAQAAGTNRPDALREFIDWVRADPALWNAVRKEAERRGETMRAAVHGQLRAYLLDARAAAVDESSAS